MYISPLVPGDDVVHIVIKEGANFTYQIVIPSNHPPGLYWYHPHSYMNSEVAVLGGASGTVVVEGLEKYVPELSGLPTQILVLRGNDPNPIYGNDTTPTWDLTAGFRPIDYPTEVPSIITVPYSQKRFLRVANAHADAILVITLVYDNVTQSLEVVAADGMIGDSPSNVTSFILGPGNRCEFIFT